MAAGRRPAGRAPESRAEQRGRKQFKLGRDLGFIGRLTAPIADRLRETFPFRRPVLTLTGSLLVLGLAVGIVSGGHVGKAFAAAEGAIDAQIAAAGFAIRDIPVSGDEHTPKKAVYAVLGFAKGQSLFAASPSAVRERLKQLPWVSDAIVRRQFPDIVTVRLIEKRPFALWRDGNRTAVVERSGAIINTARPDDFPRLPVLLGPGAPEAGAALLDALGAERAVSARLRAAERVGERRWDLLLAGGVTVKLPEEGWQKELGDLEHLIVDRAILERDIEIIDLRYPDNYVFRLHNGDSHPVPRDRRA